MEGSASSPKGSNPQEKRTSSHVLTELGWSVRQQGDEMHGDGTIYPELHVPGAEQLRTSMLASWADQLMGLIAVQVMRPRVPSTLELDIHLYTPAPGNGVLRGRSALVKAGRSVLTASVEFLNDEDQVFAVGAGSFMLAGDPDVRLPPRLSLDMPALPRTLDQPIAERVQCQTRAPGVVALPRRDDGLNASNTVNGGLLALVAEEAVLSLPDAPPLCSLAIRYLRPVRIGPAVATATLRNNLGLVEVRDEGNGNRLAVTATVRTFGNNNG